MTSSAAQLKSDHREQRERALSKCVLMRIAAYRCVLRLQIKIPEIEYYQKVSSHAQICPQGAEKQQSKVRVGGGGGGGWVYRAKTKTSSCSD